MANDPIWFWQATFTDGTTMTFWADTKILAHDHINHCARDVQKYVKGITRLCHDKDVTPEMREAAGRIR